MRARDLLLACLKLLTLSTRSLSYLIHGATIVTHTQSSERAALHSASAFSEHSFRNITAVISARHREAFLTHKYWLCSAPSVLIFHNLSSSSSSFILHTSYSVRSLLRALELRRALETLPYSPAPRICNICNSAVINGSGCNARQREGQWREGKRKRAALRAPHVTHELIALRDSRVCVLRGASRNCIARHCTASARLM